MIRNRRIIRIYTITLPTNAYKYIEITFILFIQFLTILKLVYVYIVCVYIYIYIYCV
jgi:hypothetical protein